MSNSLMDKEYLVCESHIIIQNSQYASVHNQYLVRVRNISYPIVKD